MKHKSDEGGLTNAPDTGPASSGIENPRARQRAFCITIYKDRGSEEEDLLAELKELLRTSGVAVAGELVQRRDEPDPKTYLGHGKVDLLQSMVKSRNANVLACDDELTPRQERNLEEILGLPVLDRTEIILDIFASHATTAEGKLQVELAQLEYNLARMRGLWTHLERLGGGIGTRGPGEAQIETDRRLARNRIKSIKQRLEKQRSRRKLIRAEREQADLPTIALAGYTNAGKSTLMNALTGGDVEVAERLFHTLDPTTRSFKIERRKFLITDTVGFIRKLPHQLVEAFSATLEETIVSDLILHIVDCSVSGDEARERIDTVERVLDEIGASHIPQLLVINKIDLTSEDSVRSLLRLRQDTVPVSARDQIGIDDLKKGISEICSRMWQKVELLIPFDSGKVLSEIHEIAGDLVREDTPEGVMITATVPRRSALRFNRFSVNSDDRPD